MLSLPEEVWHFGGKAAGPTVCVIAGVHGDEQVGVEVIRLLINEMKKFEINGELYLMIGNPPACALRKRATDTDLNRLFGESFIELTLTGIKHDNLKYEEKRALELAPLLAKSDYCLDIHSTIKPAVPFVFCQADRSHLDLVSIHGVQFVVSPAKDFAPADLASAIDNFVDANGGIGITFESGWHKKSGHEKDVMTEVKRFLQKVGTADFGLSQEKYAATHLSIYQQVKCETNQFRFAKEIVNFDFLTAGELLAIDGDKRLTVERDSYVIFPKEDLAADKIAYYLSYER